MRWLLTTLLIGVISVNLWLAFQIHHDSRIQVDYKEDLAELNRIGYGILSVNAWKEQVSSILTKKIDEFELTDDNRAELQASVEKALHRLLDEVNQVIEKNKKRSLWDKIKGETMGLFFDIEEFRKDIPRFAEAVLEELDKDETKANLKRYIREKLDEFTAQTGSIEDYTSRKLILEKYRHEDVQICTAFLDEEIAIGGEKLKWYSHLMIGMVILGFLLWWWISIGRNRTAFFLLIFISIVPLWSGVSTPMLDIDARISSFEFQFLGEPLAFSNQVLYFQSKSILDVVEILIRQAGIDSVSVGVLVMTFSVIFPLIKLLCTGMVEFRRNLLNNRVIKFFVLKSAKWSMADVLVVAIFMSFIGFKGVIESQLGQLDRSSERLDILTTDDSSLQIGFILFLTFTLAGLVLSGIAERRFSIPHT
ncbi:MAG: hypothetical protein HKN45_10455 [Flavobacteriales bacterium]|nr:hypothetical protein [Flavobacteriales bacterium]